MFHKQIKNNFKIKMLKKISFLWIVVLIFSFSEIIPQQKLTINEAVKIALENNFDIKLAKSDALISDNNYSLGNAGFLPRIDATGSVNKKTSNTQQTSGGIVTETNNAGTTTALAAIALNWTLFDGFKMFISYSKLKDYKELGEIKLRSQVESSVSNLIDVYYDLLRQTYNYRVAKEAITISEERVRLVEDRLSVGSASRFDLLNAKVDLNADKSNLLNQELTLNSLKSELNLLLGRRGDVEFEIADQFDINKELDLNQLQISAFKNNVDILNAEKSRSLYSRDVGYSRGDFFPKISLSGGYNYEKDDYNAGALSLYKLNSYNFGLNFSWNLFNGFNSLLAYQNAVINLDKSDINLEYTKTEVGSNLSVAFKNYKMSLEILNLEQENVEVAKENLDLAMEQLKLGSLSPIEFREAQKNYLSAQSRFSTAQYKAKTTENELLKQSGTLLK